MPATPSPAGSTRARRRHPVVSACLIVKNEEDNLPACLRSLANVADELVVYDTGSTDRTVAVARAEGARVFQGEWHDDFARARNASLAHCRGDWVIWLDADETLQCDDPAALRDLLVRTKPEIDAWSVAIDNLTGTGVGAGFVHHAARIFRRARCEWTGRLHEQVAIRGTHQGIHQGMLELARIRHTGYLDAVMTARNKSERNLRVAAREVEEADGWEKGFSLVSLGRSFVTAGRLEEGLAHCAEALDHTENPITRRLAIRTAAEACIGLGRFDESASWIGQLRSASSTPVQADAVEVKLALARGDHERALALLDKLGDQAHDEDGFEYARPVLAQQRAEALVGLGRRSEAADILLAVLGEAGVLDRHLGEIVEALSGSGRSLTELAVRIPVENEPVFMAQILQLQVHIADATLEACFTCRPSSTAVLAAAGTLARRLPIERALVWSARLRSAGHHAACPLRFIAYNRYTPPLLQARAAATAVAAFGDDILAWRFAQLIGTADDQDRGQMRAEADALCPSLSHLTAPGPGSSGSDRGTPPHVQRDHATPVQWLGPFLNHSGYGEEARGFLMGLAARGVPVAARSSSDESIAFMAGLRETPELANTVQRSLATPAGPGGTVVLHLPGWFIAPAVGARHTVARTMFETDSLPQDWVSRINTVDEVWVPSSFNADTFRNAGVRIPIHVVPGGVDADHFRPGVAPLPIAGVTGTTFLAIFEWSHRKAPDVLLRAWSEAFAPGSPVTLVLRAFPRSRFDGDTTREVEALVDAELAAFGATRRDVAPIVILGDHLPPGLMPGLMAAADVYVGVSRGEGSGRPLLEAMSCGLPVIGTRWSGNLDFMDDDNSLLVDVDGLVPVDERMDVPFYQGQRWAEPSVAHLTHIMRKVASDPALRQRIGDRARRDVDSRWQWTQVSELVESRLAALSRHNRDTARSASVPTRPRIRWVGDVYADHSLATVSRELVTRLSANHPLRIDVRTDERPPHPVDSAALLRRVQGAGRPASSGHATVEVRHQWPPDLGASEADACVLIQPWEYGGIPNHWIQPIHDHIDEVWAYTSWVRDCYVRSGVPAGKVAVVPCGVDTAVFRPDGPKLPLTNDRSTRLLFVGGTINRKGFDVLLETYLQTFGPGDDLCLVVKPFGADSVYRDSAMDDRLRAAALDRSSATVEVVDRRLTRAEMAQLYRACDVLVHPYRGEGFGLPIAEAMACGLPSIVTGYGACLDFCDPSTSWMLRARETSLSVPEFEPGPAGFWWAEPDRSHLSELMRVAVHATDERQRMGAAAHRRIATSFTWDNAASMAAARLLALTERTAYTGRRLTGRGHTSVVPAAARTA